MKSRPRKSSGGEKSSNKKSAGGSKNPKTNAPPKNGCGSSGKPRAKSSSSSSSTENNKKKSVAKGDFYRETFPVALHRMITDLSDDAPDIACWCNDGRAFRIDSRHPDLGSMIAQYYQHNNWHSLRSQLGKYWFRGDG
jgi:hypothetical protein